MDSTQTVPPQAPTTVPGDTMTPSPVTPNPMGKKIGLIVALVVFIGGAIGVGVWAWITFSDKAPQDVITRMLEVEKDVTSFGFDGTGTAEFYDPSLATQAFHVTFNTKGAMAGKDKDSAKGQTTVDVTVGTPYGDIATSYEERIVDKTVYVQITKLPIEIGSLIAMYSSMILGNDHPEIVNKWGSVNLDELEAYIKEQKNKPGITPEDSSMIDTVTTLLDGGNTNAAHMQEQVLSLYKKYDLFQVKNVLPQETVDGQRMYHYEMAINKDNLYPFLKDYVLSVVPDAYKDMTPEEIVQEEKDFKAGIDTIQGSGQVWIGKSDFHLHRMTIETSLDGKSEIAKALDRSPDSTLKMTFQLNFKDYNKAVEVAKPEGAQSLIEFLKNIETKSTVTPEEMGTSSTDTEKDTDGDGLPDFMETSFYKSDPAKMDTDGDGFNDGEEVEKGYSPIGSGKLYE